MDAFSRDLLDPSKPEGALVLGFVFLLAAVIVRLLVRRTARRFSTAANDDFQRGRIEFIAQVASVIAYVVIAIAYAHLIPSLRATGTALLASAGVMGIVLGLAAQTTLGNLIAGISIALYRPFDIGDRLVVPGPEGPEDAVVDKLTLGNTVLRTTDNRHLVVPNAAMIGQTIINLTSEDPKVQAIITVNIAYSTDIAAARRLLVDAANAHPGIDTVEDCAVVGLESSTVTLTLRAWSSDALTARTAEHDLYEAAAEAFHERRLEEPYPTMNVNLRQSEPGADHVA